MFARESTAHLAHFIWTLNDLSIHHQWLREPSRYVNHFLGSRSLTTKVREKGMVGRRRVVSPRCRCRPTQLTWVVLCPLHTPERPVQVGAESAVDCRSRRRRIFSALLRPCRQGRPVRTRAVVCGVSISDMQLHLVVNAVTGHSPPLLILLRFVSLSVFRRLVCCGTPLPLLSTPLITA